nr:nuclear apoptosis-inducing factor 1-like [Misgurnus anguillicaudatus]
MAEKTKERQRREKFSAQELDVLVEECSNYSKMLQNRNVQTARKKDIWNCIAKKVNAIGGKSRSADEIKKRWHDLRRRTKEKVAFNKAAVKKTGGGPIEEMPLTPLEELVQMSLTGEQVTGVDGIDSLEPIIQESSSQGTISSAVSLDADISTASRVTVYPQCDNSSTQLPLADIDLKLLNEQHMQTTALKDTLPSLVNGLEELSVSMQKITGYTEALVSHTRQLVKAVSGLDMSVRGLVQATQTMNESLLRILDRPNHNGRNPTSSAGQIHPGRPGLRCHKRKLVESQDDRKTKRNK